MTNDAASSYPTSAWSDWVLLRLPGEDAAEWLNGQCTQGLLDAPVGSLMATAFCDERGKVWGFGHLRIGGDAIELALDRRQADRLQAVVEERVILEDVTLQRQTGVRARLSSLAHPSALLAVPAGPWTLSFTETEEGSDEADRDAVEIALGWPGNAETAASPLVQELGPEFVEKAVSFTKGCYVGQEIVARVHSRGRVHRRWVALLASEPFPAGATVHTDSRGAARVLRTGRLPSGAREHGRGG